MADLVITSANVQAQGGATRGKGTAGATIAAGDVVAKDANGDIVIASDASAALAAVEGIALHGADAGQPIEYQKGGRINVGATLAVGKHYVLSTAGGIAPVDDIAGGEYASYIGYAESASVLVLGIIRANAATAGAVT